MDKRGNERTRYLGRRQARRNRGISYVQVSAILGILAILSAILYAAIVLPPYGCRSDASLSNVKQMSTATILYAIDYDERLPVADRWMDDLYPYIKSDDLYKDHDWVDAPEKEYGFAFFKPLSSVDASTVLDPETVPLIFPSTLGVRNAASDLSTLPATPRSKEGHPVAFLDTHAWRSSATWPDAPVVLTIRPE